MIDRSGLIQHTIRNYLEKIKKWFGKKRNSNIPKQIWQILHRSRVMKLRNNDYRKFPPLKNTHLTFVRITLDMKIIQTHKPELKQQLHFIN